MNIVEEIRNFVEEECFKPTSKYGYEPYLFHFTPVVAYAKELAMEMNLPDIETIEIAAWLHDIGAIVEGRENHHVSGAIIAENKLKELGYPKEKIEIIKKCINNHRGSRQNSRETLEEKIIAEADVLSNFDNISGIFKAAFVYEGLDQKEAQKATLEKLKNKYNQLHFEESKKLIKPKYDAVVLLLSE